MTMAKTQNKTLYRISHRIAIGNQDEIDDEVRRWLKAAYDLEAKKGSGTA
jgi:hypothetical protein